MKDPEPGELWECFEEFRNYENSLEHAIVLAIETIDISPDEYEHDSMQRVIYYDAAFGKVFNAPVEQFLNIFKRVKM